MEILDKIGKTATKTYQYTAEKTGKLAKEAKLRLKMSEHKDEIDELYQQIGKTVYENYLAEKEDAESIITTCCYQIDELAEQIDKERKELLQLKDRRQCKNCFCEIEKSYIFCPKCGARQQEQNSKIKKDTEILHVLQQETDKVTKPKEAEEIAKEIKKDIQKELQKEIEEEKKETKQEEDD